MRKWFYTRLALSNMLKNRRAFIPYLITAVFTVAMFFMMASLAYDKGLNTLPAGTRFIREILGFGVYVVALFAAVFLFYTHSFLIKRRKKEIGLFNILGMEKRHLAKLMLIETAFTLLISVGLGLLLGMLFSRLMALLLCAVLSIPPAFSLAFGLNVFTPTLLLFFGIFSLTFLHSLLQVHLATPIALLKGGNAGEKEPKNKWFFTLIGAGCLGTGYYLALTIEDPVYALTLFFVAVVLVIVGTYLLFTCGSITLIKSLKRNKRFYYKSNHFISVSGMLYRMKQNGVGLANICVLSTMVLVMLSTTTALLAGMDAAVLDRYPNEFYLRASFKTQEDIVLVDVAVKSAVEARGGQIQNAWQERSLHWPVCYDDAGSFSFDNEEGKTNFVLYAFPQSDFTALTGMGEPLDDGEIIVLSENFLYNQPTFTLDARSYYDRPISKLGGMRFTVADALQSDVLATKFGALSIIYPNLYVAVKDVDTLLDMAESFEILTHYTLRFDTGLPEETQFLLKDEISRSLPELDSRYIEFRAGGRQELQSIYAAFFFLGLFLGSLFLVATVLILYYKQLSEGHDDKARFTIMQNVGLSRREVYRAIHSQTLLLFFLPLAAAFIHIAFAFPMIKRIMLLMNLPDTAAFLLFTGITCALFAVFYFIVYNLTARVYGKIVTEQTA